MATVLIAGGSGLIGSHLSRLLFDKGYKVIHLSRSNKPDAPFTTYKWDVESQYIEEEAIRQADYVVNLAGAGIADQRWTPARKKVIIDSRVNSARLLLGAFEKFKRRPKAYVSIVGIGYYGDRGNEWMEETSPPGKGFLPESSQAWENAVAEVAAAGIRTVAVRTGIVLSTQGGALVKMLLPMKMLTATYFGDGSQWYSWIHIDDICRILIQAIENESMQGTYNGVAPNPATNKEFIRQLAEAYGGPIVMLPAPVFALRLALGEMATAILDSTRVSSRKIQETGFEFQFPELSAAFRDLFDRKI